jgi:hypothetical protein
MCHICVGAVAYVRRKRSLKLKLLSVQKGPVQILATGVGSLTAYKFTSECCDTVKAAPPGVEGDRAQCRPRGRTVTYITGSDEPQTFSNASYLSVRLHFTPAGDDLGVHGFVKKFCML